MYGVMQVPFKVWNSLRLGGSESSSLPPKKRGKGMQPGPSSRVISEQEMLHKPAAIGATNRSGGDTAVRPTADMAYAVATQ